MRVYRMGAIDLDVINKLASSALAANDMKNLMIWATVRTRMLSCRIAPSSDRKICAPARLQALVSLRYASSECPHITMLLAQRWCHSLGMW